MKFQYDNRSLEINKEADRGLTITAHCSNHYLDTVNGSGWEISTRSHAETVERCGNEFHTVRAMHCLSEDGKSWTFDSITLYLTREQAESLVRNLSDGLDETSPVELEYTGGE